MFKRTDPITDTLTGQRRKRKKFAQLLKDTAAKATVTASVTFAVGLVLKKMFENSVADAAKEGAKAGAEDASTAPAQHHNGHDRTAPATSDRPDDWEPSDDEVPPSVPSQ